MNMHGITPCMFFIDEIIFLFDCYSDREYGIIFFVI